MKRKVTKLLRLAGVKAGGCRKAVKRAMIRSLTFEQWAMIMKKTSLRGKSRMVAISAMSSLAKTAEQWLVIFENSPAGSSYEDKAFTEIEKTEGFENWHNIFEKAKKCNRDIRNLALTKMDELCKGPENRVYYIVALHMYGQDEKIDRILA